ncbi:protein REPRESSOR OF SILENCING 3 [Nymphaea colorata]|nr:protein REPRESSOR OF SILENCING 3 [Nymphaea colorata]
MGEKEEDGGGMSTTRVFVGGLGQAVTASDLEKTFSYLGRVKGVEIVRTNGRSFAYMDFEPDSQKSFNKLFSTYNGCIWKGGRLKLEKAKEHYLTRLRREWAEDEANKALCSNAEPDTDITESSSKKSKRLREEKMQLKIYFPRLRKVKLLPYAGTGKHKYSFQHVNAPPLPVHFCDCEQHSLLSDNTSTEHVTFNTVNNVIGQHELDIMNSVLEKLFKTEAESAAGTVEHNSLREMNDVSHLINTIAVDNEEAAEASDSDNLITNIALEVQDVSSEMYKPKEQIFSMKQVPNADVLTRNKPFPATEPKFAKKARKPPADGEKQKQSKKKQASEEHLNDLVHALENQATETGVETKDVAGVMSVTINEPPPPQDATSCVRVQKVSWRDLVSGKSSSSFKLSDVSAEPSAGTDKFPEHSETTKLDKSPKVTSVEAVSSTMQVEEEDPNRNAQDSKETDVSLKAGNMVGTIEPEAAHRNVCPSKTWRDMLSGKSSSMFKLSGIFQGPSVTAEKFAESSQADSPGLNRVECRKSDDVSSAERVHSSIQPKQEGLNSSTQKSQNNKETNVSPKATNIDRSIPLGTASGNVRMDEVCTFMRSAESQKEWAKVRAAVSASLRSRKRTDNSAAENAKSRPKHR